MEFDSWPGARDFSLSIASRLALGSIQTHIQWVPGALFMGIKQQEHEAAHSPLSSADIKNGVAILLLPHMAS